MVAYRDCRRDAGASSSGVVTIQVTVTTLRSAGAGLVASALRSQDPDGAVTLRS